jgi:pimeloyl-ACP methyl ester carboxylesterase
MFYFLPGMGASKEMYQGAWLQLTDATYIDWPPYRGETSLSEIADRLIADYKITANDWIGGSSLGGMVAVEIYKKLKNAKVILIGSALTTQEISPWLRRVAPLASVTPIKLIQSLTKGCDAHVLEMFRTADPDFIRAMCAAVFNWEGCGDDVAGLVRIHGERDPIIKCPKDAHVIKGAGHLVAMTHADECVRIVEKITGRWNPLKDPIK